MITRAVLVFLLFLAALPLPAAFVAAAGGNIAFALLHLAVSAIFIGSAVVYAALVVSGRGDDGESR